MKKQIASIVTASLFTLALLGTPVLSHAADSPAGSPDQTAPAKSKKHGAIPFHGKLTAVDKDAMTLTVGTRTFTITPETKIAKDGKPATLADAVVGENVGGAYKKGSDGKLNAVTVHLGLKAKKKKEATE